MTKLDQADHDFMRQQATLSLSEPGLLMGGPMKKAAEYLAIADYSERLRLRATFLAALPQAPFYTAERGAKVLTIVDMYTNKIRAEVNP